MPSARNRREIPRCLGSPPPSPRGRAVCNCFLSWAVPRSHIAIQRRPLVYAGANNESQFSIYTGFDSVCGLATWPADVGGPRHAVVQPLKRQANRVGRRF
jgi:hypothetical protein